MTKNEKLAFKGYVLALIPLILFGVMYLFRGEFMPYHAVAIGKSWDELSPNMQISLIATMRLIGGCFITTSLAILSILIIPFRKGEKWAKLTIPVLELICSLSILYSALLIKINTQASPPVIIPVISICLIIASFYISTKNS